MNGISFGGLASGIDTDSIISRLVALEGAATTRLKTQQRTIDQKAQVYGALLDRIATASQASGRLNVAAAFNPASATSSDAAVATVDAASGAAQGTYRLSVTKLAQAQKVASAAQADTTGPLNRTGTIVVGGKALRIEATDSLRNVAEKINGLGVGVSASLIDGGAGAAYLSLGATKTGAANRIALADAQGSVLGDLGVLGTTDLTPAGGPSLALADASTAVGTLLGAGGLGPATFSVNGRSVGVDLSTDSLQTVADRINAVAIGVSASVKATTVDGATRYRLELSGPAALSDPGGALHTLGILQRNAGTELVAAQDAAYTLDGIALTSDRNSVTGAIPGATLSLLKAGDSTIAVTKDAAKIRGNVDDFVGAVNGALGYVKEASQFDKDTFATGPLFGDSAARQFVSSFSNSLFTDSGLPGAKYRNLASVGFSLGKDGLLTVDSAQLDKALADRPDDVRGLFQSVGATQTPGLSYVSGTSKTLSGTYDVNVTALATKTSFVGAAAPNRASAASERLTFSGGPFGSAPVDLTLEAGSTLAATVAKINADPRLKDAVVASVESGRLRVDSRKLGTGGRFALVSNATAAKNNSGVGTGGQGTTTNGLDIAGTIDGKAATGFGQFLTSDKDAGRAQGLQVGYTGTALGAVGSLSFSRGLSGSLQDAIATFNDSANGLVTQAQKGQQDQSSAIDKQIERNNAALTRKTDELKLKFSQMEQTISRLQSQGQRLQGLNAASGR